MQVTRIKASYNSFIVLPAKDMQQPASAKRNAKFSRLVPSCRNTAFTMCKIKLLLTLILLSSERHSIKNISLGVPKLPTSTLRHFCSSTSASSTIKNTFLQGLREKIFQGVRRSILDPKSYWAPLTLSGEPMPLNHFCRMVVDLHLKVRG